MPKGPRRYGFPAGAIPKDPPPLTPELQEALARAAAAQMAPPPPPPSVGPPFPPEPPQEGLTVLQAERLRQIAAEKARRSVEGLRLYEPLPVPALFHACTTRQRLLRGSNRSGKTLGAAAEVARAVTGQDPHGKYPKEGRLFCVGKDLDHIGQVMWRKLGRPGAFKVIRDRHHPFRWRAFRPLDPGDMKRESLARPAPPLIPPRMIRSIAWENKAKSIPKVVTLVNGWEINFYSSEAKPPQGSDVDLAWFDEEIVDEDWYPEVAVRGTTDRRGHFIWSATPQTGTEPLFELHEKAAEEIANGISPATVSEFVVLLADNPHVGEQEKKTFAASLSEQERTIRIEGEFVIQTRRVFPEYDPRVHGVPYFDIPPHWTLYAYIDPGRQVCAVLFAAVSPKEESSQVVLYDELYLPACTAEIFGRQMREKSMGRRFEAFVIDARGGRISEIGTGLSVARQYELALRRHGVRSERTGSGFLWGDDDVDAGVEAVRDYLRVRDDGPPKLRVMRARGDDTLCNLPAFEWEIKRYRYKVIKGVVQDKPEDRGRVHAMAGLRYLAMHRPRFVRPTSKGAPRGAAAMLEAKKARRRAREGAAPVVSMG